VARVLIVEPNLDVRMFLVTAVEMLAHEPIDYYSAGAVKFEDVDVAIVEPGAGDGLAVATALLACDVKLVFASVFPPSPETLAMDPAAFLVKPFSRHALEVAISD
jgi:hypothetical protein